MSANDATGGNLPDAIEILALGEAEAIERIVDLTGERDTYRLGWQTTLAALHDLTLRHDRLQRQHQRLIEEFRQHREAVMAADAGRRAA